MEVVVISRNTIKPSTPTPPYLSHFQLSFLDQIVNRNIVPLSFYYPLGIVEDESKATNLTRSDQLKKSLADGWSTSTFAPTLGQLLLEGIIAISYVLGLIRLHTFLLETCLVIRWALA
ncbi:unnamed protein product [Camellia sinensis]